MVGRHEASNEPVKTIHDSAERAGHLIDDLLAFSRMSRTELKKTAVDMGACVAEVWRELAPDRQGRQVELELGAMPVVVGDPAMLRLVMLNLLANALKYTRPRERAVVEVSSSSHRHELSFSVRDNGVGFDMRYVDKLFGVFQRLHGRSRSKAWASAWPT